jgi:hypothetical protein
MPEGRQTEGASMSKTYSKGERRTSGKTDREIRWMRKNSRKSEGEK